MGIDTFINASSEWVTPNVPLKLESLRRNVEGVGEFDDRAILASWLHLRQFGFSPRLTTELDDYVVGLQNFRTYYRDAFSLEPGVRLDREAVEIMRRGHCGLFSFDPSGERDLISAARAVGAVAPRLRRWAKRELKYRFGDGLPGSDGAEFEQVEDMLGVWQGLGEVTFVRSDAAPDFEIAWKTEDPDFDMTGHVVAHAGLPDSGFPMPKPLHFDNEHVWGGVEFNIRAVSLHEIGHILGLSDSSDQGSVMFHVFRPNEPNRKLSDIDILEFQARYP